MAHDIKDSVDRAILWVKSRELLRLNARDELIAELRADLSMKDQ